MARGLSRSPPPPAPLLDPGVLMEWTGWGRPGLGGVQQSPSRSQWPCVCTCIYVLVTFFGFVCVLVDWSQKSFRLVGKEQWLTHYPFWGGGGQRLLLPIS